MASQIAAGLPKSHIAVAVNVGSAAVRVAVEAAAKTAIDVAANVDAVVSPGSYTAAAAVAVADTDIVAVVAVVVAAAEAIEEALILAVVPESATAKVVHNPERKMVLSLANNQTSSYSSYTEHYFQHCIAAANEVLLREIEQTVHSEESVASTARDTAEEDIARYRCCTAVGNSLPLNGYRSDSYGWEDCPDIMRILSELPWRQDYSARYQKDCVV